MGKKTAWTCVGVLYYKIKTKIKKPVSTAFPDDFVRYRRSRTHAPNPSPSTRARARHVRTTRPKVLLLLRNLHRRRVRSGRHARRAPYAAFHRPRRSRGSTPCSGYSRARDDFFPSCPPKPLWSHRRIFRDSSAQNRKCLSVVDVGFRSNLYSF